MAEEKIDILGNNENQSKKDFYANFKNKLNEAYTFPTRYIFKFILEAAPEKVAKLHAIFDQANASFSTKESSKGKYASFTIIIQANNADEIVEYYKQVSAIKGVVML